MYDAGASEPTEHLAVPAKRRVLQAAAWAAAGALLCGGYLVFAGQVDTPFWAPVDKDGCYWHGLRPAATVRVGELFTHGVPLPASHGGRSRIESVQTIGSAARADVTFSVIYSADYGSVVGELPARDRPYIVPLHEARLKPAPDGTGFPLATTASGAMLLVHVRASEPGVYEVSRLRMTFRQGWRKATCTRDWGAVVRVNSDGR